MCRWSLVVPLGLSLSLAACGSGPSARSDGGPDLADGASKRDAADQDAPAGTKKLEGGAPGSPDASDGGAPTKHDASATDGAGQAAGEDGGIDAGGPCNPDAALTVAQSETYTPIAVGDRWTYREIEQRIDVSSLPAVESQERVVVIGTDTVGSATEFIADETLGGPPEDNPTYRYQLNDTGFIDDGTAPSPDDPTQYYGSPAYTEIRFPITTCSSYPQFSMPETGYAVTSTATDRSFETSTVKAGTYANALRHERSIGLVESAGGGAPDEVTSVVDWYAPGVGLVQRHVASSGSTYDYQLTGSLVGGVGRGVVPMDGIGSDLHVEGTPLGPDGPAIATDGTNFLVVQAFNTGYYQGGLQATLVGPDGTTIGSSAVYSGATAPHDPAVAYGGGQYLIVYPQVNQSGLMAQLVSAAGAAVGTPYVLGSSSTPASITYGNGVFVVATVTSTAVVIDVVNNQGHRIIETTPYTSTNDSPPPAVATDGTNFLVAWATRIADPNNGSTTQSNAAAARVNAQGQAIDSAVIAVSAETGVDEDFGMDFDGTNYVISWFHRPDSSLLDEGTVRAARFATNGMALDGTPSPAGGHALSQTSTPLTGPHIARFGATSMVVWYLNDVTKGQYRVVGTRLGADGSPLDTSPTDEGLWTSGSPYVGLPAIAWGGDRALMVAVGTGGATGYDWTLGDVLLFPF
jgi:hypothetical protein